jgi:DNA-binding response OmpR family regulator
MHPGDYCIVVAEDDEILRYCTVRLLSEQGYRIIEARDGAHALQLLEDCEDAVHLLVTNFDMPRVNGIELARQMRAKHKRLMVLMISGQAVDLDPNDDIELMPKPYNQAVLTNRVRELLKRGAVTT